jgi:molybdopterin converting factor subunit 1
MKVRVLFFGATADLAGTRAVEAEVASDASPAEVLADLAIGNPALKTDRLLFAVNESYVDKDARLKDGDELAIFTPVSGG